MKKSSKIFIAGHNGMVGSAIFRALEQKGFTNIITKNRDDLDLLSQPDVSSFFHIEKPEYVFFAAAKVGGIHANNTYRGAFIYENLQIQNNIIHYSYKESVKKLLFLGSSCIYPKYSKQPIKEEYLLTGELEATNEPYAIAKIAGIKLCESYNREYGTNFISIMPTNLYGVYDNFHPENSHVLPALISKFHKAKTNKLKEVEVWGTGKPKREFLNVDELADASIHLMLNYDGNELINVGVGEDISIADLANLIADVVGYKGKVFFNPNQPDGTPRKLLDVSRLEKIGWKSSLSLRDGLTQTYEWYCKQNNEDIRRI